MVTALVRIFPTLSKLWTVTVTVLDARYVTTWMFVRAFRPVLGIDREI